MHARLGICVSECVLNTWNLIMCVFDNYNGCLYFRVNVMYSELMCVNARVGMPYNITRTYTQECTYIKIKLVSMHVLIWIVPAADSLCEGNNRGG